MRFLKQIALVCVVVTGWLGTPSAQESPDTTAVIKPRLFSASPFDTIQPPEYAAPRSFSLDHFMESLTGYLIGRRGPIGAEASFSRFGLGNGRGQLYLGNVLLNDPQDDRVPLALVPTTTIGRLIAMRSPTRDFAAQTNIEGGIRIMEPGELPAEPISAIDLSKGDHGIKQRRASFSSPRKSAGLDLRYDGLRNKGYAFDARELVNGTGYGGSATRVNNADVRGTFSNGDRYRFSLSQFETSIQGDTLDAFADNRRHGFIALAETSARNLDAYLYARNYDVSTRDSVTMNETTRFAATVPIDRSDDWHLLVGAGYENIFSKQEVGGGKTSDRLQKASASASGSASIASGTLIEIAGDATFQLDHAWGWGARVTVTRSLGAANRLTLEGVRGYRLPNLGELFLPLHRSGSSDTTDVVGNPSLKSESSIEGSLRFHTALGGVRNEFQATVLRVQDPILAQKVQSSAGSLLKPTNADAQDLQILEDRVRLAGGLWGFDVRVQSGVMVSLGTRNRFYAGVPNVRAVAAASIGRSLFKDTSHILFGAEYIYSGSRTAGGVELSSYGVTNLKLEGRLIDAHLYLLWLNVTDEQYATVWPYLMTPRTFVYGVQWTFYN